MGDHSVTLEVNGTLHSGWTEIGVRRSIEEVAASFRFTVVDKGRPRIVPFTECTVRIDGEIVITGHVIRISGGFTPDGRAWSIEGRSKTGVLVDCSPIHPTGSLKGLTLEAIAKKLCEPYGIAVLATVKTEPVKDFQISPGESVHAALDKAARAQRVLLTDTPQGNLWITRAGQARAGTALLEGPAGNLESLEGDFDGEGRFNKIVVKGQSKGSDAAFGSAVSGVVGIANDDAIPAPRVKVIRASGNVDRKQAQREAEWEVLNRAAKGTVLDATVTGYRDGEGKLWPVNGLVNVSSDEVLGPDEPTRELLITAADYGSLTGFEGPVTAMTLAPKEAFEESPAGRASARRKAVKKQVGKAGSGGVWKGADSVRLKT